MTLKDQFDVKGYDSTLGYVGRAFKPVAKDCVLVSILTQLGAIIVAKSNLPQSIMVSHASTAYAHAPPLYALTTHVRSGAKRTTPCGDAQYIRANPTSPLVGQQAERVHFSRFEDLWWAGAPTLVAVFVSRLI